MQNGITVAVIAVQENIFFLKRSRTDLRGFQSCCWQLEQEERLVTGVSAQTLG